MASKYTYIPPSKRSKTIKVQPSMLTKIGSQIIPQSSQLTYAQKVQYGLIPSPLKSVSPSTKSYMVKGETSRYYDKSQVPFTREKVVDTRTAFQKDTERAIKVQNWASQKSYLYNKYLTPGTTIKIKKQSNNVYNVNGQELDYTQSFKDYPFLTEQAKSDIVRKQVSLAQPEGSRIVKSKWSLNELQRMVLRMPEDITRGLILSGSNAIWAIKGAYAPKLSDALDFSSEAKTAANKLPGALANQFLDFTNPQTYVNWALVSARAGGKGATSMSRQALYKGVTGVKPSIADMTVRSGRLNSVLKSELVKGLSNAKNLKSVMKITKVGGGKSKVTLQGTFNWGKLKIPYKQEIIKLTSQLKPSDFKLSGIVKFKIPKFNWLGKSKGVETKSFSVESTGKQTVLGGTKGRSQRIKSQVRSDLASKTGAQKSKTVTAEGPAITDGSFTIKSLRSVGGKKFTFEIKGTRGKYTSVQKGNTIRTTLSTSKAIQVIKTKLSNFVKSKKTTKIDVDTIIKVTGTKVSYLRFQKFRNTVVKSISKAKSKVTAKVLKQKLVAFDKAISNSKIINKIGKAKILKSKRASLGDARGFGGGRGDIGNFGDVGSRFGKIGESSTSKNILSKVEQQIKAVRLSKPKLKIQTLKQSIKPIKTQMSLDFVWQQSGLKLLESSLTIIPPLLPAINSNGLLTNINILNNVLNQAGIDPVVNDDTGTNVNIGTDIGPDIGGDTGPDIGTDTTPSSITNNPIYNYFFDTPPTTIPNLFIGGMALIPPPFGGSGGSAGGPGGVSRAWVQRIARQYQYSPDLASRLYKRKAKNATEVEKLLRVGRVFTGLERRPLTN